MTIRLDGQVAIVTGAGNGLGRQYALMLAKLGASVLVNDLGAGLQGDQGKDDPASRVVEEIRAIGGEAAADRHSVSSAEGAAAMVETALSTFGKVDILVNNAGILRDKSLLKMDEADFRAVIEVHLMGGFFTTKAALPHMVERGYGRIVLTTSQSGLYGAFGQTNYAAAKLALVGFANAARLEIARKGVAINCIAPSATTRMTESLLSPDLAERLKPEYVAPIVAYLCSRECPLNGAVIAAGAGRVAINRMVQGSGVRFDGTFSVDDVAARVDEIMAMSTSSHFHDGTQHLESLLSDPASQVA